MGLYDRDYTQADSRSEFRYASRPHMMFPRLTPVVKWLLIINVVLFVASLLITPLARFLLYWFSVFPGQARSLQIWRPLTYQFLHDTGGFGHIFWNMLLLFFFGTMLERTWGSKKFLLYYLLCGAAGGLFYPLLVLAGWLEAGPLIGASGAVLGVLAANAILFPNQRLYVLGMFPIRVSVLALILAGISILTLLRPTELANAGGEAAHLGGMVAGAIYVFTESARAGFKLKLRKGAWRKKVTETRNLQVEVDRILQKVHDSGIHSLSRKEKKILREATKLERLRNGL
ncbi:MAG: rhomboid family intramembrane serine protease [Phycisphaerales bacterium]|nr:MAG: rhomboid family intramembrane serine protease [Phycisphaerales bacterium]